jgi:hypothetical protein
MLDYVFDTLKRLPIENLACGPPRPYQFYFLQLFLELQSFLEDVNICDIQSIHLLLQVVEDVGEL